MTDDTPIAGLRNLGPASAAMLARIGVHTRADLADALGEPPLSPTPPPPSSPWGGVPRSGTEGVPR